LFGIKPKLPAHFKLFWEITVKDDIQGKLKNRGKACVFVGYSVDHANNVYRMLNLNAKRIIHSSDVVWLGKSYKEWLNNNIVAKDQVADDDYEDYNEYEYKSRRR